MYQILALLSNFDVTIDGAFITALGAFLVAVGATARTFIKDKRTRKTVGEVADETKATLENAAENVYTGVAMFQSVLDSHKADMIARLDQDRAVWVGGLNVINKKVDRLDNGHTTLVEMMAGLEARLPNTANKAKATAVSRK